MKCGAVSSQTKESWLIKYDWECSGASWCSGYSHKRASNEIEIRGITFWVLLVCWMLSSICDIFDIHSILGIVFENMRVELTPEMMWLSRILIQWTVSGLRFGKMFRSAWHLTLQLTDGNVCATFYCRLFFVVSSWLVWSVCEFIPWRNGFSVPACVFLFYFIYTIVSFNHDTLSDICVISLPTTLLLSVLHLDYCDTCFN